MYLPDDLYRQAQEQQLPLSRLTQEAVALALSRRHNADWISAVRERRPRLTEDVDTAALLDAVRDEFGR